MDETPREKWATYFGLFTSVIPGMIAVGLMPKWNVLPIAGWLAVATVGFGIAGAIATPLWIRGLISGLFSGAGVFGGILLYVAVRTSITGHARFWRPEICLGALIGGAPGFLLYYLWARPRR